MVIEDADKPIAAVHIPADAADADVHLICEVHDNSPFHLVAYRRVIVNVSSRDEKGEWKLMWEDNFDSGVLDTIRTQYLLIDMQLGGAWVGSVDPNDLPVEMEIDWVRNWVRTY